MIARDAITLGILAGGRGQRLGGRDKAWVRHRGAPLVENILMAFPGAFAERLVSVRADDPRFAFGTWKIEILAGYTSAIALLGVAALMAVQSLQRLWVPAPIHYNEAIAIAAVGLGVNLLCAWWLHDSPGHAHHHHGHDHGHHHGHDHEHHDHGHAHGHDLNLRSAYVHVLADAATSVLAIVALLGGKLLGLTWLDPVMGLVGAVLVTVWAIGLLRDSGRMANAATRVRTRDYRVAVSTGPQLTDLLAGRTQASSAGLPALTADTVLVLYGDVPLTRKETLEQLLAAKSADGLAVLTVHLANPMGYGRMVRENGKVVGIVEQKDANAEQLKINEVNSGIMAVPGKQLKHWLANLQNNNAQGEFYLTDIIAMAKADGISIHVEQPNAVEEVEGINN